MKAPGPCRNGGALFCAGAVAARCTCRAKAGTLRSVHIASPDHSQGGTAALLRMNASEDHLLPAEFRSEPGAHRTAAVFVRVRHQADRTGAIIVPSGIVEDRIEADPLHRDAVL